MKAICELQGHVHFAPSPMSIKRDIKIRYHIRTQKMEGKKLQLYGRPNFVLCDSISQVQKKARLVGARAAYKTRIMLLDHNYEKGNICQDIEGGIMYAYSFFRMR